MKFFNKKKNKSIKQTKNKDKKKKNVSDNWVSFFRVDESTKKIKFIMTNISLIQDSYLSYNSSVRLELQILDPNKAGGPVGEEAEILNKIEDMLIKHIENNNIKAVFAGRITFKGIRELIFQTPEPDALNVLIESFRTALKRKSRLVVENSWRYYEHELKPAKEDYNKVVDMQVVNHLLKAGSNPKKNHNMEFIFIGEKENLEKLKTHLKRGKLNEVTEKTIDDKLVMSIEMKLNAIKISEFTDKLSKISNKYNTKYDGWGAQVEF